MSAFFHKITTKECRFSAWQNRVPEGHFSRVLGMSCGAASDQTSEKPPGTSFPCRKPIPNTVGASLILVENANRIGMCIYLFLLLKYFQYFSFSLFVPFLYQAFLFHSVRFNESCFIFFLNISDLCCNKTFLRRI